MKRLLNYFIYQRRVLLFITVALFDEQINFETWNRETVWLGETKPEKVIVLGLDDFLIFVGAQHVGRVTSGEYPAAHARTAQGSQPMGMPGNSANANGKADTPGLRGPLLKNLVGFVRTDVFGFHSHRRNG
ncbi:MAG TPA: hypothetical protein VOA64_11155 [Candidatus Dormibacteraeota bacterium]|nr:hypothetical protein [Candidatus Dormibacteraeota bacterium]